MFQRSRNNDFTLYLDDSFCALKTILFQLKSTPPHISPILCNNVHRRIIEKAYEMRPNCYKYNNKL